MARPAPLRSSHASRRRQKQRATHLVLALVLLVTLSPMVLMVNAAFSPQQQTKAGTLTLGLPTVQNFLTALTAVDWVHLYGNTLLVVLTTAALQVVVSVPAAYILTTHRFRGQRLAMGVVLLNVVLPMSVTALPVYFVFARLNLLNSFAALIVPYIGSGFCIFLVAQFIRSLPSSMFDAARIDRASSFAIFREIVLPNIWPAIAAFSIFSIVLHWNDLYWPSVVLRDDSVATVTFKIAEYAGAESVLPYNVQMAASLLSILPLTLIYLALQRHLIRGFSMSAGVAGE